jgi:TetR/AcrR family transcriptional repressor of nem operon
MTRDAVATRERILDSAQRLILGQGFSATTVDAVITDAGLTKGAFFHHFASKADLGLALVRRYAAADLAQLDEFLARADRLSRDPLQRLLLFVGLMEESADTFAGADPGCLYASYVYERELFGAEIRDELADSVRTWRTALGERIREVAAIHPPRLPVDLDSLADTFLTAFEGSYVLSRALGEPNVLRAQLAHVRAYFELLFQPAGD